MDRQQPTKSLLRWKYIAILGLVVLGTILGILLTLGIMAYFVRATLP